MFIRNIFIFACLLLISGLAQAQTTKTSVLWVDPLLNIKEITTKSGISQIVNKAQSAGFQAVALGIKTTTGHVIYKSDIAPRLLEWNEHRVPLDFELVNEFASQVRSRGMQFYVVYPMFSEGNMRERIGTLYTEHSDWQSSVYIVENEEPQIMSITQWAYGSVAYANPLNTAMQNYQISIIKEFLEEFSVDGIIFDKARFYGLEADFSDETRKQFEQFLGNKPVDWWPQDVLEWQLNNEQWQIVPGRLFHQWLEFRAQKIQSFFVKVIAAVKRADPSLPIGNFVGSWYPTYYEYGVNWASENYIPEEDWATDEYNKTALAEKFSYTVVGCFFPRLALADAEKVGADWWMSVEGSTMIATEVIDKVTPVYGAILVGQFKNDTEKFKESMKMILKNTDGLFVTDYSHVQKNNLWSSIAAVLTDKKEAKIRE